MSLEEQIAGYCIVCGKEWKRKEIDKWYYFNGTLVCVHHPGAGKWYHGSLTMMNEKMKIIMKGGK
jgi:hypothetical protein